MPKRRRTRRSRKPARKRRKRTRRRNFRPIVASKAGFPRRMVTKVVYSHEVQVSGVSVGTASAIKFGANDIYDPFTASGGHQPMFHDTYKTVYNRYRVIGSKLKFTLTGRDGSTTANVNRVVKIYSCVTDNDGLALSGKTITYLEEHPLTGKGKFVGLREGGIPMGTVYSKFSPWKVFGKDYKDHSYGALIGASPAQKAFYNLAVVPLDPTTQLGGYFGLFTIEYLVEFSDMKEPTQS